MFALLSF